MRLIVLLSVLLLSACASSPGATPTSGLTQSNMVPGDCAIFGWTTDERRSFVFYADDQSAKYLPNDEVQILTAVDPFPSLDYTDPQGKSVTLKLGQGETMVGGMRYPGARIVTVTDEGWDRFMPVAIVRSCQLSDVQ